MVFSAIAFLHALFFIAYQRPDWTKAWDDQVGYQRLGHVLATTGEFTRYPDEVPFVPETIRTPGYPVFVAIVYRVAGESQLAVALAQALLFAVLPLIVFAMTAHLATERVALAAAAFTALFPPLPYYGALMLTELLCTVLVTMAVWFAVRAVHTHRTRDYVLTGAFLGLATLTRPNFAMLPVALVAFAAIAAGWRREWRSVLPWGWMLLTFAIVLSPWLAYNLTYLHRLTIAPAGGVGRATWEASWQGTWAGRVQADLTRLADRYSESSEAELDRAVEQFAADNRLPADPMLAYVHQWRDIRRIWETPTDPRERVIKRVVADEEYWRVGLENIKRDRMGHVLRRTTIGLLVLWIGEIPIRYTDINSLPTIAIRLIWLAQAVLFGLALVGLLVEIGRGRLREVAAPAALLAYVTAVHLPLLAEARYSLPAKPVMLALVAIGLAEIAHRVLPQTGDYLP
jgi:hypothetical protein